MKAQKNKLYLQYRYLMKEIIIILITLVSCFSVSAQQDAQTHLKKAEDYIKNNKLKKARASIQDALADINSYTGKKILDVLPIKINDMSVSIKDDRIALSSNYGDGGLAVSRTYKKDNVNYIVVTVFVTSLGGDIIRNYLNQTSDNSYNFVKLPHKKEGLYTDFGNNQSYLEVPYTDFLITIHGRGDQYGKGTLVNHFSKINSKSINKTIE